MTNNNYALYAQFTVNNSQRNLADSICVPLHDVVAEDLYETTDAKVSIMGSHTNGGLLVSFVFDAASHEEAIALANTWAEELSFGSMRMFWHEQTDFGSRGVRILDTEKTKLNA
jgi:hypothetical protein